MSKLPQTDELPRAGEGYDAARVEEAFTAFADRVRELEAVAGELRAELKSLRAERSAPPPVRFDDEHWPAEPGDHPSPDWVAAVPPPLAARLHGAAARARGRCSCSSSRSSPASPTSPPSGSSLVMVAAWTLVVLSEWAAAAKRARWHLDEIAPPLEAEAADTTGPWDMPIVQATVVESGPDPESKTIVTKLPADPAEEQAVGETTPDSEAPPRPAAAKAARRGRGRRSLGGVSSSRPSLRPRSSPCPAPLPAGTLHPRCGRRRR